MSAVATRLMVCLFLLCVAAPSSAQQYGSVWKPSAVELTKLPNYCWGQFMKEYSQSPAYTIPPQCGAGMNHFCLALIFMNRANTPGMERALRRENAKGAQSQVQYTLQRMTPDCPIATDVRMAEARARILLQSLK